MIICIELSQRTKNDLDRLLNVGQYRDYSEAVAVAISNQILLHGDAAQQPPIVCFQSNQLRADAAHGPRPLAVPALFASLSVDRGAIKVAPPPNDLFEVGQEVSVDRWIFGQHNKLLPVKATCRALAKLLQRDGVLRDGVPLSKAASEIASEAVMLGDFLRQMDKQSGAHRDDALAFAFPYSESPNGDKSRLRYANQFVASLSKQGLLTGLPVELKLVNRDDSRNPRLLLTEAGWELARLANPILDGSASQATERFTEEEVDFFVQHIRTHLPAEDFAFRVVLSAIAAGKNTPNKLDDVLEQFLPKRDEKPFTRAFLTTQRAGVMSQND